jgi:hypothetical protein
MESFPPLEDQPAITVVFDMEGALPVDVAILARYAG